MFSLRGESYIIAISTDRERYCGFFAREKHKKFNIKHPAHYFGPLFSYFPIS